MANFKVGQRVRVIANHGDKVGDMIVGHEGMLVRRKSEWWCGDRCFPVWIVSVPTAPFSDPLSNLRPDEWACMDEELAPLTDPKADAFLESIRKLKPYEEPKVPYHVGPFFTVNR